MSAAPRVFVAVPSKEYCSIRFIPYFFGLLGGAPPNSRYGVEWNWGVAESRESLAEQFLAFDDCTHILFLDTDVLCPPNTISLLLEDNKPIVSGCYMNSLQTGLAAWSGGKALQFSELTEDLTKVDLIGLGACLIKRDVFTALKDSKPWFKFQVAGGKIVLSEDFHFLQKHCEPIGIKPYVDRRVQALHVRCIPYSPAGMATRP